MIRHLVAAALLSLSASTAFAQAPPPPPPPAAPKGMTGAFQITVDVGQRLTTPGFSDSFDVPLYTETEHVTTTYPDASGLFVGFGARYRIWKQLTVGVSASTFSHTGDATVTASLPHPFFDNTPRNVEGTASTKQEEVGIYPTVGWLVPLSPRVQIALAAGPAIMRVKQQFVTSVHYSETYPYDTAIFTSADVDESSASAVGFYAGVDVSWMFSKHVGAGGLVQYARATVNHKVGDRSLSSDAGAAQVGGGLRLVF